PAAAAQPHWRGSWGHGLVWGLRDREAGNPGQGAQRARAPWARRWPPPLLRLEHFQSRDAALLAAALAQSSSSYCSGSSSSFPPAAAPAAGFQRRARAPPPPFPPSPSSRSLPANFPEPRPAAQSSGAALWPNADLGRRARLCPVFHPRAPGAPRREQDYARGWGPRQSPGEMAGHWAFG
ncbi:hypothetical protein P7K49_020897, partial [Saguinus oedipus]